MTTGRNPRDRARAAADARHPAAVEIDRYELKLVPFVAPTSEVCAAKQIRSVSSD
jgi:tryptophan synthase alpha subunit